MPRQLSLRLSVTPSCAFHCSYCQPKGTGERPVSGLLRPEEIGRLVGLLSGFGVTKVRLTGGEPLSRPDCAEIIGQIRAIPSIRDIALTTNGEFLPGMAADLKRAGLDRINIHLDTLKADRFRVITGRDSLITVLAGIEAAQAAELVPIKVNTVLMADVNDDELDDFCRFGMDRGITVRFIELMNTGPAPGFVRDHFLSAETARRRIARSFDLLPCTAEDVHGPAKEYRIAGSATRIGFIASETEPFCDSCNRIRLTAEGRLRGCLYEPDGIDIRPLLSQAGTGDRTASSELARIIMGKRSYHPSFGEQGPQAFSMSRIGG